MANKLAQKTIDKMWVFWQEKQSVSFVSRKVRVSRSAVNRYRRIDKWDERLIKINHKAIEKADNQTARDRARDIRLVEAAKSIWAQQLTGKLKVVCPNCQHQHEITIPKLKAQFRDLDTFVRLSELLAGEVDSRLGTTININLLPVDPVPRQVESKEIERG